MAAINIVVAHSLPKKKRGSSSTLRRCPLNDSNSPTLHAKSGDMSGYSPPHCGAINLTSAGVSAQCVQLPGTTFCKQCPYAAFHYHIARRLTLCITINIVLPDCLLVEIFVTRSHGNNDEEPVSDYYSGKGARETRTQELVANVVAPGYYPPQVRFFIK